MEPYRYTPLEQGQTRLLQILPGPEADLVSCKLFTVNLEDLPEYTALSYVWGSGTSDNTIIVEGKALMVGVNLDDALWEFRMRPVWTGDVRGVDRIYSILKASTDIDKRYSPPGGEDFVNRNLHPFIRGSELMTNMKNSDDDDEKLQIIEEMSTIFTHLEETWEEVALRYSVPKIHRDMPLI
ncbi:hypothetical protein ACEPPN_001176 [Leptodophora sp. 'Broadleaf-Isolate-01']